MGWPHRNPATQVSHRVPQRLPGFRWELGWSFFVIIYKPILWKKRRWIPKWLDDWWLDVAAETSQFVTCKFVEHFPILCCKSLANEEDLSDPQDFFLVHLAPQKDSTVNFVEAPSECSQSSSTPFFGYIFCISPIKGDERSENPTLDHPFESPSQSRMDLLSIGTSPAWVQKESCTWKRFTADNGKCSQGPPPFRKRGKPFLLKCNAKLKPHLGGASVR